MGDDGDFDTMAKSVLQAPGHHEKVATLVFDYNQVYFILFVNFVKAIIFFIEGFTI